MPAILRTAVVITALILPPSSIAETLTSSSLKIQSNSTLTTKQTALSSALDSLANGNLIEAKFAARKSYVNNTIWNVANGGDGPGQVRKDFSSPMFISAIAGSLFGDAVAFEEDKVTLGFNRDFGSAGRLGTFNLQASFNRNPEVSVDLLSQLPTDQQAAFKAAAGNDFSLADDATYSLEFKFARGMFFCDPSTDDAGDANSLPNAFREAGDSCNKPKSASSTKDDDALHVAILSELTAAKEGASFNLQKFAKNHLSGGDKAENTLLAGVNAANNPVVLQRKQRQLYESGSQFYVSFASNVRDELIGGNSLVGEVTYEWAHRIKPATVENKITDKTASCMNQFKGNKVEKNVFAALCSLGARNQVLSDEQDKLNAAERFKFSFSYEDFESQRVTGLPGGVTFRQKGMSKKTLSVGYGRLLSEIAWLGNTWLSIEAEYEDASDNDLLNDRWVGTLSFTKKFADRPGFSLPFSIIYSNEPQFVMDNTDEKLSAQFGIQYTLNQ